MSISVLFNALRIVAHFRNHVGIPMSSFAESLTIGFGWSAHTWRPNPLIGKAGILCLADVSSGRGQTHVISTSGKYRRALCTTAWSVHSFPRFCWPNNPNSAIDRLDSDRRFIGNSVAWREGYQTESTTAGSCVLRGVPHSPRHRRHFGFRQSQSWLVQRCQGGCAHRPQDSTPIRVQVARLTARV